MSAYRGIDAASVVSATTCHHVRILAQVATASLDCSVRVWAIPSGACLATLTGHTDKVGC